MSIHLPNFLSVYLSICLSIILSVDQCVCDSFFYPTYFVLSICLHNCFSCILNIFLYSCFQLLSLFLYLVLFNCEFYTDNVLSIHVLGETFLDDSTFFFILIFSDVSTFPVHFVKVQSFSFKSQEFRLVSFNTFFTISLSFFPQTQFQISQSQIFETHTCNYTM